VNVGRGDEDRVGEEEIELDNTEAHGKDTSDNSKERDEQPVE